MANRSARTGRRHQTSAYTTPLRQDRTARRRPPGRSGRITDRPRARPRHNRYARPRRGPGPDREIACPHGFVCIYPTSTSTAGPASNAPSRLERHLPDYIRDTGSSVINNSNRPARVHQKANYLGRRVSVGREGGTNGDLPSYRSATPPTACATTPPEAPPGRRGHSGRWAPPYRRPVAPITACRVLSERPAPRSHDPAGWKGAWVFQRVRVKRCPAGGVGCWTVHQPW
ncbi:peptidase inhibitor family I36 protein [Streptomyces argyrophylli]|uniref:peptidase inhibitor family I36 protein n=1 Tax=Streptomyces argyrophylli TaxID=2726118 RepID=UPI002017BCD0|nr:peptidase inhibitor family I36 protein [Streptomyces argyrophyllae]